MTPLYKTTQELAHAFACAMSIQDAKKIESLIKESIPLEDGGVFNIDLNDNFFPALNTAIKKNASPAFLKALIDLGADINKKDHRGTAPLHCVDDNLEVIALLLDQGATIDIKDNYGNTPLGFAASSGNLPAVKFLLGKGANINSQNQTGYTAAMAALFWAGNNSKPPKSFKTAYFLIAHQDSNPILQMRDGETLLDIAKKKNDTPPEILSLIERRIAEHLLLEKQSRAKDLYAKNMKSLEKILPVKRRPKP